MGIVWIRLVASTVRFLMVSAVTALVIWGLSGLSGLKLNYAHVFGWTLAVMITLLLALSCLLYMFRKRVERQIATELKSAIGLDERE